MHKHKRNEGIIYEPPITRNIINDEVSEELAGNWSFLTHTVFTGTALFYT